MQVWTITFVFIIEFVSGLIQYQIVLKWNWRRKKKKIKRKCLKHWIFPIKDVKDTDRLMKGIETGSLATFDEMLSKCLANLSMLSRKCQNENSLFRNFPILYQIFIWNKISFINHIWQKLMKIEKILDHVSFPEIIRIIFKNVKARNLNQDVDTKKM